MGMRISSPDSEEETPTRKLDRPNKPPVNSRPVGQPNNKNEKEVAVSKLHIFIDGSWLYKACSPGLVLASKTENSDKGVRINFSRLNKNLLHHVQHIDKGCDSIGDLYLSTSLFRLPDDFDRWPEQYDSVLPDHVEKTKRSLYARGQFVQSALDAGYSEDAVYKPVIKTWILDKLLQHRYQEKQVDATVVALLVRSAIIHGDDYHCVITGDSDILPAIKVAYPEYSKNVFVATSHHDELKAEHRQTAFSLSSFKFNIPAFYLQDHLVNIISGDYPYACAHCHKVFVRSRAIPKTARPCCGVCNSQRT
ncbi:hypothetical protein [Geobacter sulfurreducens]|uniref:hypothetical protein n=1 Tax=Geobacter sulfurreducens TaxID=35554 RepID=UPI0020B898C7|nr:hypothetical protein [Geobacter sulfurreducens]UTG93456.1 hypothetical protein J8622_03760 [Geobacter sulfurreducens]